MISQLTNLSIVPKEKIAQAVLGRELGQFGTSQIWLLFDLE
jgi:hypothetical protein